MKKSQNRDNPIHGKLLTKSFTVGHIKNATFTVLVVTNTIGYWIILRHSEKGWGGSLFWFCKVRSKNSNEFGQKRSSTSISVIMSRNSGLFRSSLECISWSLTFTEKMCLPNFRKQRWSMGIFPFYETELVPNNIKLQSWLVFEDWDFLCNRIIGCCLVGLLIFLWTLDSPINGDTRTLYTRRMTFYLFIFLYDQLNHYIETK